MYTSKNLTANQAPIASKPAPTVCSAYFRKILIGCQAAIAGRAAPTVCSAYIGCQAAVAGRAAPTGVMGWFQARVVPDKPTDKSHGRGRR